MADDSPGLDVDQFRFLVVHPVLNHLRLDRGRIDTVADLLVGTALKESLIRHLDQGDPTVPGPAFGVMQIEQRTHQDVWKNYLQYRRELADRVRHFVAGSMKVPTVDQLIWNLGYSVAIARLVYRRSPDPIPRHGDVAGYAAMWKKVYNTRIDVDDEHDFVARFNRWGKVL